MFYSDILSVAVKMSVLSLNHGRFVRLIRTKCRPSPSWTIGQKAISPGAAMSLWVLFVVWRHTFRWLTVLKLPIFVNCKKITLVMIWGKYLTTINTNRCYRVYLKTSFHQLLEFYWDRPFQYLCYACPSSFLVSYKSFKGFTVFSVSKMIQNWIGFSWIPSL